MFTKKLSRLAIYHKSGHAKLQASSFGSPPLVIRLSAFLLQLPVLLKKQRNSPKMRASTKLVKVSQEDSNYTLDASIVLFLRTRVLDWMLTEKSIVRNGKSRIIEV